jgi:aldose 1-epimerase
MSLPKHKPVDGGTPGIFSRRTLLLAGVGVVGAAGFGGTGGKGVANAAAAGKTAEKAEFGRMEDGTVVHVYTLDAGKGVRARIMTYGATLIGLDAPDRDGKTADVVLGFDTLAPYVTGHPFFGSTVGRYGNRIAKGRFTLDGREYRLATNNGPNHLHGGPAGFDKKVWAATPKAGKDGPAVEFAYTSPDGDAGYPGTLKVTVTYTLTADNTLRIEYAATTDAPTPVNLTNHSYFNLAGGKGDILKHVAEFRAPRYTPVDADLIPTGEVAPVAGTPFDFAAPHAIGERIASVPGGEPKGYDHNLVRGDSGFGLAARVTDPASGRVLEMHTDQPGFQFYTGNFLDGTLTGKGDTKYEKHAAFCLEAQHYPDSPNRPDFPSTILRPGQTYRQRTEYRLSVAK